MNSINDNGDDFMNFFNLLRMASPKYKMYLYYICPWKNIHSRDEQTTEIVVL